MQANANRQSLPNMLRTYEHPTRAELAKHDSRLIRAERDKARAAIRAVLHDLIWLRKDPRRMYCFDADRPPIITKQDVVNRYADDLNTHFANEAEWEKSEIWEPALRRLYVALVADGLATINHEIRA